MQNNKLGKVAIDTSKRPKARFNLPYDVNTTSDWGSLQPSVGRMMYPGTKNVVQVESLTRLAPMLAPTFGRVALKQFHQFVDLDDVWPAFSSFYAKKAFNGLTNYVPQSVPCVNQSYLSLFVLTGCKMSFYQNIQSQESTNPSNPTKVRCPSSTAVGQATLRTNIQYGVDTRFHWHGGQSYDSSVEFLDDRYMPTSYSGAMFDFAQLLSDDVVTAIVGQTPPQAHDNLTHLYLPTANNSVASIFDTDNNTWPSPTPDHKYNEGMVNLEGADYVIPLKLPQQNTTEWNFGVYVAIRLSSYGKRIRKVLQGLGYQIDFNTTRKVSLLPLMCFYKAYYDLFAITQQQNYQNTALARFSNYISQQNLNDINYVWGVPPSDKVMAAHLFKGFMLSLGDCFYTEQQDFISAHTQRMSTADDSAIGSYTDIVGSPSAGASFSPLYPNGTTATLGEAAITSNPFGQIDIEMLKKLYRWTNAQSMAGRQIADAIRAQGFGSFVDECKSNFIGSDSSLINISDVVSTSDTFQESDGSRSGSLLGEYGGRGIGYDEGKKSFTFETDKFGYWIGMFCIVPLSGYSQGLDPTLTAVSKFDFYNSEFDGLGFEADDKSIVVGGSDWPQLTSNPNTATFGLVPTYTRWKVAKNIQNGDFNLRSTRETYQPYCLDKEIPYDSHDFLSNVSAADTGTTIEFFRAFNPSLLSVASPDWRYVGRFSWMSDFDRIFANFNQLDLYKRLISLNNSPSNIDSLFYISNAYDNFLIHMIVNMVSYAPMRPIEDSYVLEDDSVDSRVEKS